MASYQKYKTKKGQRWLVQYYIKNPQTGENKPVTKRGFTSKGEAVNYYELIKEDIKLGKKTFAKLTFEEVFKEWFQEESKKLKEPTMKSKKSKFDSKIIPHFAKLLIDEITEDYCQKFIEKLEEEIKSARDYGIQLNLVFKYAKRKRYITDNPMEYVVYSKTRSENGEENDDEPYDGFWSKEEIEKFLLLTETNTELRNFVLFRLALYTGARKGELLALREEDLIEDTKEIRIRKTLYWAKGNVYKLLTPKTKKALRTIKVDDESWDLLQKLILSNKASRLAAGKVNIEDKFIFIRDEFRPLRLAYPNEILTSLCRRFGFREIKFHGLRHTHASLLFAAGARMKEVQERLGHARIDTTMNIYTHITEDTKEDVQNKFMEYMNRNNSIDSQNELTSSKHHQK